MGTLLFATTRLSGLYAAGRTADLQRDLLAAMLERHLGPAFAGLFAEFETRDSDTRDWFVDAAPGPINIRDLPPEHATALKTRCDQQIAAIRALADRLDGEGANSRNLARALRDATIFPPEDLWFYKGAPMIVNWGFSRFDGQAPTASAIAGATVILDPIAPPPIAPTPAPESPRKKRWFSWLPVLLWLVFVGLVTRIYADLLPACALQLPARFAAAFGNCPVSGATDDLVFEGLRLQRQVEQAELDLARHQPACDRPRQGAREGDKILHAGDFRPDFTPVRRVLAAAQPDRALGN
jgi:hypothetical protein